MILHGAAECSDTGPQEVRRAVTEADGVVILKT